MSDRDIRKTIEGYAKRIAELEEELDRFRNGFKGACLACESVAMKNIELEAALYSHKQQEKANE
jgi:hypothetical protein